jgi:hypothetical protein
MIRRSSWVFSLFTAVLLLHASASPAQNVKRFSTCDTLVQNTQFNRCRYRANGTLRALAYVDESGQLNGGWIEYGRAGRSSTNIYGQYSDGKKNGEWVFRNAKGEFLRSENYELGTPCGKWWINPYEFVELDKRGKVIAKGSGSRDNLKTF